MQFRPEVRLQITKIEALLLLAEFRVLKKPEQNMQKSFFDPHLKKSSI
jgi:hypothetical protein